MTEEELDNLCSKYGFRYDTIGHYIRIYSIRDTWFVDNKNYKWYEKIKLLHANNYGGAGAHRQKVEFSDLQQIFRYIDKHDKQEMIKRDRVLKIAEELKNTFKF